MFPCSHKEHDRDTQTHNKQGKAYAYAPSHCYTFQEESLSMWLCFNKTSKTYKTKGENRLYFFSPGIILSTHGVLLTQCGMQLILNSFLCFYVS